MALTTIPSAGAKLRASVLSSLITEVRPVSALKVGDQTVNNSSTLVNDTNLFCSVVANAWYAYELHLTQNSNATANFKINFTMPAGAVMIRSNYLNTTGAAIQHAPFTGASIGGLTGAAADAALDVWGSFTIGANAGTLQLQWAQNVANASNTIVRDGSFLVLRRLS